MTIPLLALFEGAKATTELPTIAGDVLTVSDHLAVVDDSDTTDHADGSDKVTTLADLITFLQRNGGLPRVKALAADHSISSTTGTECDMSLTLEAGTYTFDYYLILQTATTSVSPLVGINFTGTVTAFTAIYYFADASSSLLAELHTMDDEGVNTFGFISGRATRTETTTAPNLGSTATLAASTINVDIPVHITGSIVVSVAGDLELWHSSETATVTRVEAGSSVVVHRTA
jgi:hypothetical protein